MTASALEGTCRADVPLLQAGTLSGNPLAMTAGLKTLEILDRPGTYEYLEKITNRLITGLLAAARDAGHEVCGGHISGEQNCDVLRWEQPSDPACSCL